MRGTLIHWLLLQVLPRLSSKMSTKNNTVRSPYALVALHRLNRLNRLHLVLGSLLGIALFLVGVAEASSVQPFPLETGQRIQPPEPVSTIIPFPRSNRLLSVPYGGNLEHVQVWNLTDGTLAYALHGMDYSSIVSASISGDETILTANSPTGHEEQTLVRLWNGKTGSEAGGFTLPFQVKSLSFAPSGKTILAWGGRYPLDGPIHGDVVLIDPLNGKIVKRFSLTKESDAVASKSFYEVIGAALLPGEEQMVTFANHGSIVRMQIWDVASGKEVRRLDSSNLDGLYIFDGSGVSHDGRLLLLRVYDAASRDLKTVVMNIQDGSIVSSLAHNGRVLVTGVFSPDDKLVLTPCEDDSAVLWEAGTGRVVRTFAGHIKAVRAVAFSSGGSVALTGGLDSTIRQWSVESGRELLPSGKLADPEKISAPRMVAAVGHLATDYVQTAAFSTDDALLLTGSVNNLILWNVGRGAAIRQFPQGGMDSVAISPDKARILSADGDFDGFAVLWDTASGKQLHKFSCRGWNTGGLRDAGKRKVQVDFTPTGLAVASCRDGLHSWEVNSGQEQPLASWKFNRPELDQFDQEPIRQRTLTFSSEGIGYYGRSLAVNHDGNVLKTYDNGKMVLWNGKSFERIMELSAGTAPIVKAGFSPDGRFIQTESSPYGPLTQWDIQNGGMIRQEKLLGRAAFMPDGKSFFVCETNTALMSDPIVPRSIDLLSGEVRRRFTSVEGYSIDAVAVSRDGALIACAGSDNVKIWNGATGQEAALFKPENQLSSLTFSPDHRQLLALDGFGNAVLYDSASGGRVKKFEIPGEMGSEAERIQSAVYAPDGKSVLAGSVQAVYLLDAVSGAVIRAFRERSFGNYNSVAFSIDGRYVLGGGADGLICMWNAATGEIVRRLAGHSGSVSSVSFSPDGRFILSSADDGKTILWDAKEGTVRATLMSPGYDVWVVVAPDGRYDSNRPGELKGVSWVMPNDPLDPLPVEIFMKEYFEPRLLSRIVNGEVFKPIRALSDLNRVQPKVTIIGATPDGKDPEYLQLEVEVAGGQAGYENNGKNVLIKTAANDLRIFRDDQLVGYVDGRVVNQGASPYRQTFRVHLPSAMSGKEIDFSAYAFNDDRVKSATARKSYLVPDTVPAKKGNAYLINMGVNSSDNPAWDLRFAANDARLMRKAVGAKLQKTGAYQQVVSLSLISDGDEHRADKALLHAILDRLAGRSASPLLRNLPGAEQLRLATPDDLVLITFSGHGYADESGNFYLLTQDTGKGKGKRVDDDLLKRSISSEELSQWLRDVDAGDMTLIVDACQSAASVEGKDFKPGPMGSRGLGQLAFDKGMRILAASQADEYALENDQIKQGLLSFALVTNGIEDFQADNAPKDGKIMLDEWLRYGVSRVPGLAEEIKGGKVQVAGRGDARAVIRFKASGNKKPRPAQQPTLFDFARKRRQVEVAGE